MHKELDTVPSYPSLPSKLICKLLSLTLHVCQCYSYPRVLHLFFFNFLNHPTRYMQTACEAQILATSSTFTNWAHETYFLCRQILKPMKFMPR